MYQANYHPKDLSEYSFLVSGGAGFIGSHLVEYLLHAGARIVRVIDNLSEGSLDNIGSFLENPRFQFVKGDITLPEDCQMAVCDVDFVLHQAALGSVPRSIEQPFATNQNNVTGTLNMLKAAASTPSVKRLVFASSSSVYGDHPGSPKVETNIGKPLSPYAASKHACELYAHTFFKNHQLPTVGLRYFNVFGPRQNPNGAYAAVIPAFIRAILANEPLNIFGDGEQGRDFTFVENVVQANIKACFASKKAEGEVFNVGNHHCVTVNQLAAQLLRIAQKNLPIEHASPRPGDVRLSLADISKAAKLLEYAPSISFEEGLAHTYAWYKTQMG